MFYIKSYYNAGPCQHHLLLSWPLGLPDHPCMSPIGMLPIRMIITHSKNAGLGFNRTSIDINLGTPVAVAGLLGIGHHNFARPAFATMRPPYQLSPSPLHEENDPRIEEEDAPSTPGDDDPDDPGQVPPTQPPAFHHDNSNDQLSHSLGDDPWTDVSDDELNQANNEHRLWNIFERNEGSPEQRLADALLAMMARAEAAMNATAEDGVLEGNVWLIAREVQHDTPLPLGVLPLH